MKKKTERISEKSAKKRNSEDSEKGRANPKGPYVQTKPPLKGMPTTIHPHQEEILD